jgi:hypothetical protein
VPHQNQTSLKIFRLLLGRHQGDLLENMGRQKLFRIDLYLALAYKRRPLPVCPPWGHGVDKIAKNGSVLLTQAKKISEKIVLEEGKDHTRIAPDWILTPTQ